MKILIIPRAIENSTDEQCIGMNLSTYLYNDYVNGKQDNKT